MIYRVLRRLAVGPNKSRYIEAGSVINEDRFGPRIRGILLKKGILSPVSAPPLDAFPGWKLRAVRFTEAGYDAVSILITDDGILAKAIGSNVRSIEKWKGELREFLGLGDEPIETCCGGKRKVVREEPQLERHMRRQKQLADAYEKEAIVMSTEELETIYEEVLEPEEQAIEEQEDSDATDE